MKLNELLDGIYSGHLCNDFAQKEIYSVSCDSRKVMMGGIFVALKGLAHDGNEFIDAAVEKGAFAVATESDVDDLSGKYPDVCFLKVEDVQNFLEGVVFKFFGDPSQKVRTIGVTGTNGKTTVAYLAESIFNETKEECGVIGTINYRLSDNIVPAPQTTPSFIDNQHFLTGLAWQGVPHCVIEVSSHALAQRRVFGIDFKEAVFTNLTGDHLDYHETMENYFNAKSLLFTGLSQDASAIINVDDPYGRQLVSMTKAKVVTYGIEKQADVAAKDIQLSIGGGQFTLVSPIGEVLIKTKLIGMFNIYNVLAAAAACIEEGVSLAVIQKGIERLAAVPGRLERVENRAGLTIFIDYAHTQDALLNVLSTVREVTKGRILLLFGCGGNRDKLKRPEMGHVAGKLADFSIVTSDNPRDEDPRSIIDDILPGFDKGNYKIIINREEAIREILETAHPGDTVLLAGKGHETYQVLADGKVDFNEREIIAKHFDVHDKTN